MYSFPKRKYYVLRLLGGISAGLLVCLLEVFISNLIFTIVTMYLLTFYVAFFIWLCLDVSLLQAVSLSAAALLMQDVANSIYQSVSNAFFENLEGVLYWLLYVAVFAVSYVILWFVFIRRLKKEKVNLKQKDILFLVVIVVIANQIIVTVGTQLAEDFWSNQFIRIYFLICCLLTLFLQFGFFKQNKLEIENQQMEKIINQQAEQYRLSKENIELINLKCHDLKKQIQSIRKISNK
jgi:cation transport ATPase